MAARKAQKKSYVKYIVGPGQPTPKPKPSKTPYAKSHQEYIGNPSMEGGKTAKTKAALQKAIKGGAAKAAKKLAPNDYLQGTTTTKSFNDGKQQSSTTRYKKATSPRQQSKRNMIANNIINDLSKTAMRAKIVEMNVVKKRKKK